MFHAAYIKRVLTVMAIVLLYFQPVFARLAFKDIILQNPVTAPIILYHDPENANQTLKTPAGLTIVHFWATWCGPCIEELPMLDSVYKQYKSRGLAVLPLTEQAGSMEQIQQFYRQYAITTLPVALDMHMRSAQAVEIKELPATLFINSKGQIIGRANGPINWQAAETKAFIEKYLAP